MSDLAGALDRIQELENRLESSQNEFQRQKRDLANLQREKEHLDMSL